LYFPQKTRADSIEPKVLLLLSALNNLKISFLNLLRVTFTTGFATVVENNYFKLAFKNTWQVEIFWHFIIHVNYLLSVPCLASSAARKLGVFSRRKVEWKRNVEISLTILRFTRKLGKQMSLKGSRETLFNEQTKVP
jgi:hypothetical protein